MLEFYVAGQSLKYYTPVIAADSLKFLTAQFHFIGDEWDGYTRWAHFRKGETVYDIELDEDDRITEEDALNLTAGEWDVYMTGTKDTARLTTVVVIMTVKESGLIDAPLHVIPQSVAEQIDAKAAQALAVANAVKAAADAGKFNGKSFEVKGYYDDLDALAEAVPNPTAGESYGIGTAAPYHIYIWDGANGKWVDNGTIQGPKGDPGTAGTTYTPHVDDNGNLSWTNDGGEENPETKNIKGPRGTPGSKGDPGKSAYDAAKDAGYTGTEATFYAAVAMMPSHHERHLPDGADPITIKEGNIDANAVSAEKIKDKNVTAAKLADECKNIIRESVALAASAFVSDTTIEGAQYKAELAITGCTAAMLPIIAWTAAQSEELDVKRIQSAAGKIIIYSADAPGADLTIPTVALISPIGTGSSGTGTGGSGTPGANGVTFTPHLSADGVLSWTNDGGLANPDPVNIKGAPGAKGDKGDPGSGASVTATNIKAALGYTPADSEDIPTVPTEDIAANTAARHSHSNKVALDKITGLLTAGTVDNPGNTLDLVTYQALMKKLNDAAEQVSQMIPTELKNPNALTIKVDGTETAYDGSEAKTVEISTASAGDDTPDYVLTAADALAKKVVGHIGADNIVFAVIADAHLGYYTDTANAAGKQAGQALKRLNERCALDFVAHVGDYSTGAWNTTSADALEDNADYQLLIGSKYPGRAIWCPGNHDDAPYQATANRLTQMQMYAAIGRKNLASGGCVPGNACYGYMDFPGLRLRVIYLDTHDHRSWGTTQIGSGADNPYLNADNISAAQLQYLADTALDFSGISNPAEWSILVFSHAALNGTGSYTDPVSGTVHPSNTANAAALLKAYATKQSGSITHGGSTVSYDFSAITPAQIIACIHGHEHRYANETVGGAFLSVCCPNILNGRERASADGNTYTKTAGTANGTSFCVFSINRAAKKIYVDHYGPGIDREFGYTVLDPNAPSYTNQLPLATDTDGSIYNGTGWMEGYRLNSSGSPDGYSGSYLTGFIPAQIGDVVRLKNVVWQNGVSSGLNSGNQRVSFYDSNKNYIAQTNAIAAAGALNGIKDENGIWTQFTLKNFSGGDLTNAAYFRLNCAGLSAESIITVNEEIETS